jgi:hypothetical protein
LTSAVNHAGGAIELTCFEQAADVDILEAPLTAIRVDSIGQSHSFGRPQSRGRPTAPHRCAAQNR